MRDEKKALLIKYIVCFVIASLITVGVFAINGFFTDSVAVNLRIISDGFTVAGTLFLLFAGMLFISGEGALIGIGFVLRYVVLTFIPGGRKRQETYKDYRARKMTEVKKSGDHAILLTGLFFFLVGVVFLIILYANFYDIYIE